MRKCLLKKVNPQEDRFTRGKWSWEDLNLRVLSRQRSGLYISAGR